MAAGGSEAVVKVGPATGKKLVDGSAQLRDRDGSTYINKPNLALGLCKRPVSCTDRPAAIAKLKLTWSMHAAVRSVLLGFGGE